MEVAEIVKQFNWVDVLVISLLIRAAYIGIRQGFVVEVFKLGGVVFAAYFALHYYSLLGNFLATKTPISQINSYVFFYILLSCAIIGIFALIRQSLLMVIKIETIDLLARWGGLIFGVLRGILTASIICVFFVILNNDYLKTSVRQSYAASRVVKAAPSVYSFILNNLVAKFNTESEQNRVLFDTLEGK